MYVLNVFKRVKWTKARYKELFTRYSNSIIGQWTWRKSLVFGTENSCTVIILTFETHNYKNIHASHFRSLLVLLITGDFKY